MRKVLGEQEKDFTDSSIGVRIFLDRSETYFKLQTFRVPIQYLVATMKTAFTSLGIAFAFLFLSLGAALVLCSVLDNYYLGFIVVVGFFGVFSFLIHIFKRELNHPTL